jgi:hypothetical protein
MDDRDRPSTIVRLTAPLVVVAMSIGSFVWFFINLYGTINSLLLKLEIINFNKGVFYMLGVALGLAILAFVLVQEYWFDKPITDKMAKVYTKIAVFSVVVMFLLPQVIHFGLDKYLTGKGYVVCGSASHQWLLARRIGYVKNMQICDQYTQKIGKNEK